MYQNVVFDLDGTLLDTLQDLAAAGNHTLSAMELPQHPVDSYRMMVGNGIPKLIERVLPAVNRGAATQDLALHIFTNYYNAHKQDFTAPYPGIMKMLEDLVNAGVCLGIASNKGDAFVKTLAAEFFPGTFQAVVGLQAGVAAKPDPACVHNLLAEMGAQQSGTLYVGDSGVDMQTAKNAGLCACGVLWGFRSKEELLENGADLIVESPQKLAKIILN